MPIEFEPFDARKPVRIYRRHLPHWRQDGATYFVTYRLGDSLPQHCVQHLAQLRAVLAARTEMDQAWLEADRRYFAQMKGYLSAGYGRCWLAETWAAEIVDAGLRHFDECRYALGEYAIMPNHVHALVKPLPPFELEEVLHGWKSYSASEINRRAGRKGPLWQDETYDRIVRDSEEYVRTVAYIRGNKS